MRLPISKPTAGQEIVKNFLRAANYQESADVRWEARDFEGVHQSRGVYAYPCQRKKRFWFFGHDRWIRDCEAIIYLKPLILDEEYDEIETEVGLALIPEGRTIVTAADNKKWRDKYSYLQRQLTLILKNAFLIK